MAIPARRRAFSDRARRTNSSRDPASTCIRVATIPLRIRPSRAICAADDARWSLDGVPVAVPPPDPPAQQHGSCAFTLGLRHQGRHRLAVVTPAGRVERTLAVDDRLVVVLGDSVASGEGNPRRPSRDRSRPKTQDGVWLERRCHRSSASGFEVAARQIARRTERATSVTFVNLACSGATVPNGILGPYRGIEFPIRAGRGAAGRDDAPLLEPQIDRLRRLDRRAGGVDAVLVSIGANDVGFGRFVVLCATRRGCARGRLDGRPAAELVPELIAGLDARYAALSAALKNIVPDPRDVLLTEYFDPTHDREGRYCTRSLGFARREDMRWAEQSLLTGLDDAGRTAARRHGFSYVGGIRRAFARHGYCARDRRWVVRIRESLLRSARSPIVSRTKGTMHPNAAGHEVIAARIAPVLARRLGAGAPVADARPPGTLSASPTRAAVR